MTGSDLDHLAHAVALARGDEARTAPNPTVGCVLVDDDGAVVSTGVTEPPGGRHAEIVALHGAGDRARDAIAVVTLEPCAHVGRTGACTRALLDAGVARVVVGALDPVPGHGGGVAQLRAAGVVVDVIDDVRVGGWSSAAAPRFHARAAAPTRPWVTVKLAATVDGATVPPTGRWITGPAARRAVHAQRGVHAAVLVGIGTVLADDPQLDVRHVPHDRPQPVPVVLDSQARTPTGARLVARGGVVVHTEAADAARLRALRGAGAQTVAVPATQDGRVLLSSALAALLDRGLHDVYAEPGRTLAGALVAAGVVDELVVHGPAAPHRTAWPVPVGHGTQVRVRMLGDDREDVFRFPRPKR